jgi:Chaperone for protein-folding within the ER, fungal
MFLAYRPPQMLPTSTLNPTATPTAPAGKPTGKSRVKRAADGGDGGMAGPSNTHSILTPSDPFNADSWWWVGIGLTAAGTLLYMYPTSSSR